MRNIKGKCIDENLTVGLTKGNTYYILIHDEFDSKFCTVARNDDSECEVYLTDRFKEVE